MFLKNGEGWTILCAYGRAGQALHYALDFAFAFPLQKILPPKVSDMYFLNLSSTREARGNPISPYATLRAARISGGETSLALKLESLLYSARTYFSKNLD